MTVLPQRTLPRMFEETVPRYGTNVLMLEKKAEKYEGATYYKIHQSVEECAGGLLNLDIVKGDRIGSLWIEWDCHQASGMHGRFRDNTSAAVRKRD